MKKLFFVFLLLSAWVLLPSSAFAQLKCLDYYTPGVQGDCKTPVEKVERTPEIQKLIPRVKEPEKPVSMTLEGRINEFYETYDKPPREFVAFHLEPTLENALKWAAKYQSMMDRNKKLAEAWDQARAIYQARKDSGENLPELDNPLPPVEDFSSYMPKLPDAEPSAQVMGMVDRGGINMSGSVGGSAFLSQSVTPALDGRIGGVADYERESREPVRVNYYFSAECPYCEKFEPVFQRVIQELGPRRLRVTCVDMSPSNRVAENVNGKIDCEWRPLFPNENQIYGIETTPTLIVMAEKDGEIERLAGVIGESELRQYFLEKRP